MDTLPLELVSIVLGHLFQKKLYSKLRLVFTNASFVSSTASEAATGRPSCIGEERHEEAAFYTLINPCLRLRLPKDTRCTNTLPPSALLTLSKAFHPIVKSRLVQHMDFTKIPIDTFLQCVDLQNAAGQDQTYAAIKSIKLEMREPSSRNIMVHTRRTELLLQLLGKVRLESLNVHSRRASFENMSRIADVVDTRDLQILAIKYMNSFAVFHLLAKKGLPKLRQLKLIMLGDCDGSADMQSQPILAAIPTLRRIDLEWECLQLTSQELSNAQWQVCVINAICAQHNAGELAMHITLNHFEDCAPPWQLVSQIMGIHVTSIHFYSDSFPIGPLNMDTAFPNLKKFRLNAARLAFDDFTMPPSVTNIAFYVLDHKLNVPVDEENLLKLADLEQLRTLSFACPAIKPEAFVSYAKLYTACERKGIQMLLVTDYGYAEDVDDNSDVENSEDDIDINQAFL